MFGLMQGVFMLCKYLPDILTPCQIIQYISVIDRFYFLPSLNNQTLGHLV